MPVLVGWRCHLGADVEVKLSDSAGQVMSSKEGTAMAELPELPAGSPLSIRLVNYEASKIPFRLLLSNLIGDSCRSKALTAQRSRARCGDRQRIRLEELAGEEREEGRVPRTVECNLLEGLVDSVIPGDVVTLCGLVQYTEGGAGAGGRAKAASGYVLYVDAISDLQDMMFFVQATEPFQLLHLVHSLCPAISGHELVKCGMLLALFGGVQKFNDLGDHVPIRGDIHVMVVGDPGLGKSQMLKAACAVAPRGVYVCGNTASAAGLT
eukprot:gene26383-32361_t